MADAAVECQIIHKVETKEDMVQSVKDTTVAHQQEVINRHILRLVVAAQAV